MYMQHIQLVTYEVGKKRLRADLFWRDQKCILVNRMNKIIKKKIKLRLSSTPINCALTLALKMWFSLLPANYKIKNKEKI